MKVKTDIVIQEFSDEEYQKLLNSDGLSVNNIIVPSVYEKLFTSKKTNKFALSSGRVSGKTSILVVKWWERINAFPNRDIVILQATATEIKDSIRNEIRKFLVNSGFDVGDDPKCEYYFPKSNDRIVIRGKVGTTYFYPITDSNGGQRSRGINTPNKLSLIMYEEAQKNRDKNVLEQSVITFVRQMEPDAQLIVVGNNETAGHWFVDYIEEKKNDEDWCYIYSCCEDIWELLNKQTQDYIEGVKKTNPLEYRRIFLGDINANTSDVVFPQFTRQENYKKIADIPEKYITNLIIGIDHATANDTFAVVPVAILDDGTTQTLEVCFDDPEITNTTLAPTEQCELLEEFVDFLDRKYGIYDNRINTILSVDGQASPFIAQLKHLKGTAKNRLLWRDIKIKAFTMKKKDINLGIIKSAFAYKVLVILNEGKTDWRGEKNTHRLASEIERQRYKRGKLDPAIKNDLCDALEYGLIPYYINCYNISFPVRMLRQENHYQDIRKLANIK